MLARIQNTGKLFRQRMTHLFTVFWKGVKVLGLIFFRLLFDVTNS